MYNQPGTYEMVTTYDRRLFYPSTLGIKTDNEAYKFMFPTKAGKVGKISKIPSAGFAYGIYHVKVESHGDKRFEKMFAFSKNDHYTHTSLNFVMNVYNKHHGGNIQLTLIGNTCLKYDKKCLVESSSVFRNWYSILQKFKLKFPKNKLIKHLASSAWGHLVSTNTIIKPFDDVDPDDYSTDLDSPARYYLREVVGQSSGFMFLKLVDKEKPYFKYQLIKDTFDMFPNETKGFELHPFIKSKRTTDKLVIVKKDGKLYKYFKSVDKSINGSKNKRSAYDWEKTYKILQNHIDVVNSEEKPATKRELNMDDEKPAVPVTIPGKKAKSHIGLVDTNSATIRNLIDEFDNADVNDEPMTGKGLRLKKLIGRGFKGGAARSEMSKDHLQKQIGTKFVVLKALREGNLVLRYPSGTSVARKLPISQAVADVVDDVIGSSDSHSGRFDVSKYNQLSNNDKKIIYDLFKITRYDQTLRTPLANPYELDEAEKYMLELAKLKGQLELGNRNERNIAEFCRLSTYLYKLGMLNNKQLQDNISLLA
ncbi:hypothetical protein DYB34_002661 [Aphanomyces astaci]|uniref:Uncharacterized protein n=1 Tax=Aphanomyces astaci TaxID=112090 RepID=A0A418BR45_APHAT|nr:hypothetical protein DYB34_002661 [Aphanomyces astaci]